MIQHLSVARSAYFFSLNEPLTDATIRQLFTEMRRTRRRPSNNLFAEVRILIGHARVSAICFSFERPPAFLAAAAADVFDRVHGLLVLIERGELAAVITAGLELPSRFRSAHLGRVPNEKVERAIARQDAIFEQMRLRNMSASRLALRSKSFEARDLESVMPMASANRYLAQGYRVRHANVSYAATPSTGRISVRGDRVDLAGLAAWATAIFDRLLEEGAAPSTFIDNFARPLGLDALAGRAPTGLIIDVPGLADRLLGEEAELRLIGRRDEETIALDEQETKVLLDVIDFPFPLQAADRGAVIISGDVGATEIGRLRIGKARISLSGLRLPALDSITVERRDQPVGADPESAPLARYIDREDLFTVLFDDIALAYVEGSLYRDDGLVGGGARFLQRLLSNDALVGKVSEKGAFVAGQTAFDTNSVFGAVVNDIAAAEDILVCDDLSDEWADFIGLSGQAGSWMVSFYHAKHGNPSLSASAFHDAVGQGLKNLGRMSLPADAMPKKIAGWTEHYRNDKVDTNIPKILKGGGADDIAAAIEAARIAPDLVKRAFIVTSSLSKAAIEQVFEDARGGKAPPPHFVQLYWLLTNYFSACQEMGVGGYVVCRP